MTLRVTCQKLTATRSGPMYSNFCSGKSWAVITALTPGSAAAFDVSIERMRAWACGERKIRPTRAPAVAKSAPYIARPVTFGTPSGRIGRVPTHLNRVGAISFTAPSTRLANLLCITVARRRRKCKTDGGNHGSGSKADRHRARPERQGCRQDRRAAAGGQPSRAAAYRRLRNLVDRQDAGRQFLERGRGGATCGLCQTLQL